MGTPCAHHLPKSTCSVVVEISSFHSHGANSFGIDAIVSELALSTNSICSYKIHHIIPLGVLLSLACLQALHPEQIEASRTGKKGPSLVTRA